MKQNSSSVNERYRRFIEQIDNLPALPEIVSRLIKVVNSPDTSADDAARLIQKDPALTSKMLRLANSAFYGIPRSISSVSSAVVILGFNTIRSLVLSASVMKMFPKTSKLSIDKDRFWKHSVVCAMAAKDIVRQLFGYKIIDPESAFCAGILHDIGKLIFMEFAGDDYSDVSSFARKNHKSLFESEKAILGIDHAELGKILADKWALPLDLEYALVFHHEPMKAASLLDLVTTVHLANRISHTVGASLWEDETVTPEWKDAKLVLRLGDAEYEIICKNLADSINKSEEFIDIIK